MYFKHLRYQLRNLFQHFGLYWLQVSLALFAIFFVQIVQRNIDVRIQQKGQALLGADISVSLRGKWEGQEKSFLPYLKTVSVDTTQVIDVSVMITANERSLLVAATAVEDNYPLYGDVEVGENLEWRSLVRQGQALVYQEVLDQLGAKIGDTIKVGETQIPIAAVITNDSASGGGFTAFLPRIIIAQKTLDETKILGPMSSEFRRLLFKLKDVNQLEVTSKQLSSLISDPSIRVNTRNSVSEQSSRILDYLTDYMGLISIVTILLTFFGSLYLFRHFFFKQLQNIAIFKSLGFSPAYIQRLWIGQMLVLSLFITATTFVATYALFPTLAPWLLKNISKDMPLQFFAEEIYIVFFFSIFLSLVTHFIYSRNIKNLKPTFLLKQGKSIQDLSMSYVALIVFSVIFILFSFVVSRSWVVTSIFVGSVLGFFALSYVLLRLGFWSLYQLRTLVPSIKYISLNFYRNHSTYLFLMISLSFGFTLLSFLPSVKTSLLSQIEQKGDRPKLFLFDVQDFQLSELKEVLATKGIELQQESPMIRARLLKVNDKEVVVELDSNQSTREEEQASRFRNRAFNLSYRSQLSSAEKIIEGKDFSEVKSEYPKVSIEKRFAERMNLEINDILTFDIQDIEVKAQVVNFRVVNWFTLQPNFFVLFEDGVLNEAPKTFLATIGAVENVSQVQYEVASRFPNISMIDLDRLIVKILEISSDFEFVLTIMSYFCIFMGIFVFISIYIHFMERRKFDMQIMKVLGFSFRRIFALGLIEYVIALGYAVGLGIFIGSLLSYLLVTYYFKWTWTFDFTAVVLQSLVVFGLSLALMIIFTLKDFLKKPQSLLKTEG